MKRIYLFLVISLAGFCLCSCNDDKDEVGGYVEMTDTNVNANDASADASLARWEMPKTQSGYDYITHYIGTSELNYALEYAPTKYHAHWVAYRYDSNLKAQKIGRTDEWGVEPFYNNNKQYQVAVQYFSGYNRGHILGSAERLNTREANVQTFYMSNMSPMLGNFNSIYWGEIEDLVRTWGRNCDSGDTLYVVKGATIDDRILGTIFLDNTLGNQVQMVIPKYYFIAVLSLSSKGIAKAIGFWLEHKDYGNSSAPFLKTMRRGAVRSIDELEELTHIDFFCNLPDWAEDIVESHYNISSWSGL